MADLKQKGEPQYLDEILEGEGNDGNGSAGGYLGEGDNNIENDPLYDQAVRLVTESRRASVSAVQRRFKIGYNRAARMVEQMESAGVVGPLQGNGMREVLAPLVDPQVRSVDGDVYLHGRVAWKEVCTTEPR